MKLFVKNQKGLVLPSQAHPNEDACHDIVATSEPIINGEFFERMDGVRLYKKVVFIEYQTDLCVAPETVVIPNYGGADGGEPLPSSFIDYHLKVYARSSVTKYNLILKNCVPVIDNGYRAQILLRFAYTFQPEDFEIVPEAGVMKIYGKVNNELIYQKGNKIAQIEAVQNTPITFELVDKLPDSQRNEGKFGSSGK